MKLYEFLNENEILVFIIILVILSSIPSCAKSAMEQVNIYKHGYPDKCLPSEVIESLKRNAND
jgi:hypothetical protein